jgi:hypothetical protein
MLGGALMGGYPRDYPIRVLPALWVTHFVIVVGVLMSIICARQYWF